MKRAEISFNARLATYLSKIIFIT